jgi:hypothetical protein
MRKGLSRSCVAVLEEKPPIHPPWMAPGTASNSRGNCVRKANSCPDAAPPVLSMQSTVCANVKLLTANGLFAPGLHSHPRDSERTAAATRAVPRRNRRVARHSRFAIDMNSFAAGMTAARLQRCSPSLAPSSIASGGAAIGDSRGRAIRRCRTGWITRSAGSVEIRCAARAPTRHRPPAVHGSPLAASVRPKQLASGHDRSDCATAAQQGKRVSGEFASGAA